jgi:hypothetical protein
MSSSVFEFEVWTDDHHRGSGDRPMWLRYKFKGLNVLSFIIFE